MKEIVFALESAQIMRDKVAEIEEHTARNKAFMERHPDRCEELKSQKILSQTLDIEVETLRRYWGSRA